jgi:ribulose-phosphate 3-epimerase
MHELLPAILAEDEATFRERVALVQDLVPVIHLDVMDGAFVPNRCWFDAGVLAELKTPVRFELHLMVKDPARILEEVKNIESVIRAIWHIEAEADHAALIARTHELKKEAGLAISPKTSLDRLVPFAGTLDEILVMGNEPGFSGQPLEPHTIERVWELHGRWPQMPLGFDISVNADTIPKLKEAGVTRFCAAGAIFKATDPRAEISRLQKLL